MPKLKDMFRVLFFSLFLLLLVKVPLGFAYYAPLQDVIAYLDGRTVVYKVYDPILGKWMESSSPASATATVKVQEGIVAWNTGSASGVAVYDPGSQSWVTAKSTKDTCGPNIIIKDGVAAMIGNKKMSWYNFNGTRWEQLVNKGFDYGYAINAGFVAHTYYGHSTIVEDSIVDVRVGVGKPYMRVFIYDQDTLFPIEDLVIDPAGTVTWSWLGESYKVGYFDGEWHAGQDSQPTSSFLTPALTNGNTWFADLSLSSTSWHYDFGDGTTSTERSPLHSYAQEGTYIVTQTVTSPNGSDTTTRTVKVDKTPPTGTISINGGSVYTNSRQVTLSIAGTDANNTVLMRFSDDGATWRNWVRYSTNRVLKN